MRGQSTTMMIINLDTLTNEQAVIDMLGQGVWDSGMLCSIYAKVTADIKHGRIIPLPDADIGQASYQKKCNVIGLLSDDNYGPLTIDKEGYCWVTQAGNPIVSIRSGKTKIFKIARDVPEFVITIPSPSKDGRAYMFGIDPVENEEVETYEITI